MSGTFADSPTLLRFLVLYVGVYAAYGTASPNLPRLLDDYGLDKEQIGLWGAAGTAIGMISAPIVGRVADRYRAWRLPLVTCATAAGVAALGYLPARGFAPLMIVGLVHFASLAPLAPVSDALALAAARRDPDRKGFEYGWVRGSGAAAFIIGSVLAGQAIGRYGFTIVPWLDATLLAVAAAGACLVPQIIGDRDRRAGRRGREQHVVTLLRLGVFRRVVLVAALILGSHAMHDRFAMIRWTQEGGISTGVANLLWSESVVAEVVIFLAIGPMLLRWLGCANAIALAALAGLLRWSVAANTVDVTALIVIQPLHGFTFALLHLACMRLITSTVPPDLAATAQAIYGTVGIGGATVLVTLVSGMLYERVGAQGFWVMAALCAAAIPIAASLPGRPTASRS
jgi:MFS transporter, PPP family, 3-phenylpropionic acid transporter